MSAKYIPELDGLRAVAVLIVVLFHVQFEFAEGGFVGVDVFFVISGYLISGIIVRKLGTGSFSLIDFYMRRVKRLFPALFATIMISLLVAPSILIGPDLTAFYKSAAAAIVSLSNVTFYLEAGYWDADSLTKPLLHTWSLGVEEQFYLFWPALLILLYALKRFIKITISILLITLASSLLSYFYTDIDSSAAFYLFPFRVFQFSFGALVYLLCRNEKYSNIPYIGIIGEVLALFGIALIAYATVVFDENTRFPGHAAFIPTLGTCFVLMMFNARGNRSIVTTLLALPIAAWIGRLSYAIYLAHWPIIVFYTYRTGPELALTEQLGLILATFVGGALLHYGVERAFYSRSSSSAQDATTQNSAIGAPIRLLGVGALGVVFALLQMTPRQTVDEVGLVLADAEIAAGKDERRHFYKQACSIENLGDARRCNSEAEVQVLVIGDSHEVDGYNFVYSVYGARRDFNLIAFGETNRCKDYPIVDGVWLTDSERCNIRRDVLYDDTFVSNIDVIFYASSYPFHRDKEFNLSLIRHLLSVNPDIKLISLGTYIHTHVDCHRLINQTGSSQACGFGDNVRSLGNEGSGTHRIDEFMELTDLYIDRVALLCEGDTSETCEVASPDGTPFNYDKNHNSLDFALHSGWRYHQLNGDYLRKIIVP